jgi:hypothetical protein
MKIKARNNFFILLLIIVLPIYKEVPELDLILIYERACKIVKNKR